MIQSWIADQLKAHLPDTEVTVDYEANSAESLTVYYEGGMDRSRNDLGYRFLRYMVWVKSPDWGKAEYLAASVRRILNGQKQHSIEVNYTETDSDVVLGTETVYLKSLDIVGEPNRIGVEDRKMLYSVNFDATLVNQKGEEA